MSFGDRDGWRLHAALQMVGRCYTSPRATVKEGRDDTEPVALPKMPCKQATSWEVQISLTPEHPLFSQGFVMQRIVRADFYPKRLVAGVSDPLCRKSREGKRLLPLHETS